MQKLIEHLCRYNKDTNINIKEFSDKIYLIIDKNIFDIVGENLYEFYWHYNKGKKHFEFIYVLGDTFYRLNITNGIEVFNNLKNSSKRFQLVSTDVDINFKVRMIYSEEDRRTKEIPNGCIKYGKEIWIEIGRAHV